MFYRKAMVRESVTQKVIKVVLLFIFFFSFLRFTFKSINNKKYVQVEQSGFKKKLKKIFAFTEQSRNSPTVYIFIYLFFSNSAF